MSRQSISVNLTIPFVLWTLAWTILAMGFHSWILLIIGLLPWIGLLGLIVLFAFIALVAFAMHYSDGKPIKVTGPRGKARYVQRRR